MKILVTGGCGFIGSHLADALVEQGHTVTILDNLSTGKRSNAPQAATLVVGDVADEGLVTRLVAESDAVFHLAAIASVPLCEQQPEMAERINLTATQFILDAASQNKTPVMYASSAAVYGDNPNLPLAETEQPNPLSAYGRHKLGCEQAAAEAWRTQQVPSIGFRFFNVYGPRQDPSSPYSGVISIFTQRAQAGQPITFFGDGEQTRDFIYVGDIVRLLLAALDQTPQCAVVNGCTGRTISLKQLATAIATAAGTEITTTHAAARGGDIRHSCGNPTHAISLLQVEASTTLTDGLTQLLASTDDA